MFHGHLDSFQKPPLGGRPNTKPGDHGTSNAHNRWFILFYHMWGPAWTKFHWNSIRLRARSHMTSRYSWGFVTTLHDVGGELGRPWDTFFWALTIPWSRLLPRVWSGPYSTIEGDGFTNWWGTTSFAAAECQPQIWEATKPHGLGLIRVSANPHQMRDLAPRNWFAVSLSLSFFLFLFFFLRAYSHVINTDPSETIPPL